MTYLNTTQSYANRIDINTSDKKYEGIFTDSFNSCVILIIYSEHTGRISLTHKDSPVPESAIQEELDWVENGSSQKATKIALIGDDDDVMGNSLNDRMSKQLVSQFTRQSYEKFRGKDDRGILGASIDRNFKIKVYLRDRKDKIPSLTNRPNQEIATAVSMVNTNAALLIPLITNNDERFIPSYSQVIYDGISFRDLKSHEKQLNELVVRRMEHVSSLTTGSTENEWKQAFSRMWFSEMNYYQELSAMGIKDKITLMNTLYVPWKIVFLKLLKAANNDLSPYLPAAKASAACRV